MVFDDVDLCTIGVVKYLLDFDEMNCEEVTYSKN